MGDLEYFVKSLPSWRHLTDHLAQYQRHIDHNLKDVKLNLDEVSHEHTVLREIVAQMLIRQMTSPDKELDGMSDIIELKAKVNDIDQAVRRIETEVAVVKNTIELRFETVTSSLKDIKQSITDMKTDGVTGKRYRLTTGITIAAIVIALLSGAAAWYKIFNP